MRAVLKLLPSFLGPGVLLFLVSVQVACGFQGFVGSEGGPLRLLEVPAVLLGWGGVALLLPMLAWLLLDWWGASPSGFALKSLGGLALGIAVAGLAGMVGGRSAGGVVGADLAGLLSDSLSPAVSVFVLLLMAVPAAALSFGHLGNIALRRAPTPPTTDLESLARKNRVARELPQSRQGSPYPSIRYDAAGNELPVEFSGSRDVGPIRFADDIPRVAAPAATAAPPATSSALPTIRDVLAGRAAAADEEVAAAVEHEAQAGAAPVEEPDEEGPIHVDAHGVPIPKRRPPQPAVDAKSARPPSAASVASANARRERENALRDSRDEVPAVDVVHLPEAGPPASLAIGRDRTQNAADALQADVRYADERAPTAPQEVVRPPTPAGSHMLEQLKGATANRVAREQASGKPPATRAEEKQIARQGVLDALAAISDEKALSSHLEKLEASGLFDQPRTNRNKGAAGHTNGQHAPAEARPAEMSAPQKALVARLREANADPLFQQAVEMALERGSVSLALLTRALGTTYARSREILDRLLAADVVGPPSETGTHPTVLTRDLWSVVGRT